MPVLPITGENLFNDFLQVYGVMYHPDDEEQRNKFVEAQYTKMRLDKFGTAGVKDITMPEMRRLCMLPSEDMLYGRLKKINERAHLSAILMSLLLANFSNEKETFELFLNLLHRCPALDEYGCRNLEADDVHSLWNEFKYVSFFHIAKPCLLMGGIGENVTADDKALMPRRSRNYFDIYLGMMAIDAFPTFLAVSEKLRKHGAVAHGGRGLSSLNQELMWTVPEGYPLPDINIDDILMRFHHFCLSLQ